MLGSFYMPCLVRWVCRWEQTPKGKKALCSPGLVRWIPVPGFRCAEGIEKFLLGTGKGPTCCPTGVRGGLERNKTCSNPLAKQDKKYLHVPSLLGIEEIVLYPLSFDSRQWWLLRVWLPHERNSRLLRKSALLTSSPLGSAPEHP